MPNNEPPITLHVINHTHWDREWFVPYTITRRWIPNLIHNLEKVVQKNPDYSFLFDAQTMVIEDLEASSKESYAVARRLIENHNLEIGPYYAQLEMRNPGAESLVRNLRIGIDKALELGGSPQFTAWDVDTFGHISQSPQIHALFGIRNVYMWRGPSELAPFFWWKGADGTSMLAIDLFAGGYRNFYKVTSKNKLAIKRLNHEVRKLYPFYKFGHIPVFDGFDLDKEPGDAASYFHKHHASELAQSNVQVVNSSPYQFADAIRRIDGDFPTFTSELISGKYSSVFPGTLSARVYSKLLATHAEQLLYRYAEPISLLLPPDRYPEKLFENQTKLILQNLVHDVISGCSIDQVHDYSELRAAEVDRTLKQSVSQTLTDTAGVLADGTYAFVPNGGPTDLTLEVDGQLYQVTNQEIGITRVKPTQALKLDPQNVENFSWKNQHYQAELKSDGILSLGEGQFGELVVRADDGDTYWDEPRGQGIPLKISGPIQVMNESTNFAQLAFTAAAKNPDYDIQVKVKLTFDQSPIIKWQLILLTVGSGFSVALRHNYGHKIPKLNVGMQFDNTERDFQDTNLMERDLSPKMRSLLIGQRDLYQIFTFPFHTYVTPSDNPDHVHLLAKGLRAYQTEQPGIIDLILTRPVDWVMKPGLHKYHSGDAGPKFLVPGARCERETTIECALLVNPDGPGSINFHQMANHFLNPPLLFQVTGSSGRKKSISLFKETAPISSLHQYHSQRLARIYNPTDQSVPLSETQTILTRDCVADGTASELSPKRIATLRLTQPTPTKLAAGPKPSVTLINWPKYPVGPDMSKPSPESLAQLSQMQDRLQTEHDQLKTEIEANGDDSPSRLLHRFYIITRELMEARLSLEWNLKRLSAKTPTDNPYTINEELYKMATEYNDMRIVRRMYDYIVDIDAKGQEQARPTHHSSQTS
ncbi:MAG TPA: hypothetical protein VGH44_02065 [Candidatus Saccharimonadia bacterium]|jgi:alpha-mannosidase